MGSPWSTQWGSTRRREGGGGSVGSPWSRCQYFQLSPFIESARFENDVSISLFFQLIMSTFFYYLFIICLHRLHQGLGL